MPRPNGTLWNVNHAKTLATDGWDDRGIFAKPASWNANGTPYFGAPTGYTSYNESNGQPC